MEGHSKRLTVELKRVTRRKEGKTKISMMSLAQQGVVDGKSSAPPRISTCHIEQGAPRRFRKHTGQSRHNEAPYNIFEKGLSV